MIYLSSTTFGGSKSLIIGNTPENLTAEQIQVALAGHATAVQTKASLGLFNTGAPNYNTYYPDIDVADVKDVKESDFIYPVFRALTKTIVSKFMPIDFSEGNVLKDSLALLEGQALFPNHEQVVGQELGAVLETVWQEATSKNGIKIPAGINAKMKLDVKTNPKIARGILMDPPSIHSTSVTVTYKWEKSHTELSDTEFWQKLGSYDANGELVRAIVREIRQYGELSLVPHGADRFAQKIGADGKIINPEYAQARKQFSVEEQSPKAFHFLDYSLFGAEGYTGYEEVSLSAEEATPNDDNENSNNNSDIMNREELIQQLGLSDDATDEQITQAIADLQAAADNSENNNDDDAGQEGSTSADSSDSDDADSDDNTSEFDQILNSERDEAVNAYQLAMGDDADPQMIEAIRLSTYKQAKTFQKQFKAIAAKGLGNGASAQREGNDDDAGDSDEPVNLTNDQAVDGLLKGKFKRKSFLHGEEKDTEK